MVEMVKLNKKTGETSTHVEGSLSTIGERLRSTRESKGLSLEDVHKATKIHPNTINDLEKGRLEDKVGEAYVRAFIKNYAAYLGMDAKSIMAEYSSRRNTTEKSSAGIEKDEPRKKEQAPRKKAPQKNSNTELIRSVMAILVSIAVIFALMLGLLKFGQYAKGAIANIKIKKSTISKKAVPPALLPVKTIIPIPRQDKLTLSVAASSDVWLKVIADGKVVFHKALSRKSKETWKAEKEIRLAEIGKPEALELNVNGKEIDFSENRLSRSILITQEGIDFEPK
ncbi:MAG: DUF4115 domain-containing protein [Candidatus Omnitrophota bacterium]|nr:DUF4115 domain-containing protein [Candidatus Omnitrophota bacterium]